MPTDDFSLPEGRRPVPPPVAPGAPPAARALAVADLEEILDTLEEEIFLIERSTGAIVWMSPACRALTHKLGSTRNIGEFPALRHMIDNAVPPDSSARVHSKWHTASASWDQHIGEPGRASISVFCRAGETENVWVRLTRYSDRDDYFRQYVADNERLSSASRSISMGEMATTLAHELNQPLGTLINIVAGIRSRIDASGEDADEILDALELAEKQGRFASEILLRARSFTRSREPLVEHCDVNRLIRDTLDLLDWMFQAEDVDVNCITLEDELTLHGDATLLQQVLVNLFRNAIEAMGGTPPEERTLTIVAGRGREGVAIDIADTGHGLGEDHEKTLFTPFRSDKPGGMGVGLNICRSFIELHQGRFWFTAARPRGCVAHIVIPDRDGPSGEITDHA